MKEKFDLVVIGILIHWIPPEEKLKVFKTIFEVLESSGTFPFNSIHDPRLSKTDLLFDSIKNPKHRSNFYSMFYTSTIDEYEKMVSNAGFVKKHGREETTRVYFESVEAITKILASSIHSSDFEVLLSKLRDIINNDDIDKSFFYIDEGRALH